MQGNWNNKQAYCRCRFPQEYALVNEIDHPKVVYLREAEIAEPIDEWLLTAFGPAQVARTVEALTKVTPDPEQPARIDLSKKIAECDRKLVQYRATLDAGGDPIEINDEKKRKANFEEEFKAISRGGRLDHDEIIKIIGRVGDLTVAINRADPMDRAELYREIGLKMVYIPQKQLVEARLEPDPHMCRWSVSEGCHEPLTHAASSWWARTGWTSDRDALNPHKHG